MENTKRYAIALDFDGTITQDHTFPEIGEPRMWLIEQAIEWQKQGHLIILWTCREDVMPDENTEFKPRMYLTEAVEFCSSHGLYFDAINMNISEVKYPSLRTSRKINSDFYIDDKSVVFNDDHNMLISKDGYLPL